MIVKIGNETVDLNSDNLKFNEASINEYFQKEAVLYNYYSEMHTKANLLFTHLEDEYEALKSSKFVEFKPNNSDKLAEAMANSDLQVQAALDKVRKSKANRDLIHAYLRSYDKAHDNCLNLAYNIRKELDKLFPAIKHSNNSEWSDTTVKADEIFSKSKSATL